MKYVFCSSIYNMKDYDSLSKKSKISLSLADHNLNSNIILGLDEATGVKTTLVNNTQIPSYPKYPKVFFKRQLWAHSEGANDLNCGFINLPVLKHISRAITTFKEVRKIIKEEGPENVCLLTYDLRLGISIALKLIKKFYKRVRTCVVLPDIPTALIVVNGGGKVSFKAKMRALVKSSFINQYDSYVFLTEYMKEAVNVENKSYTIVEGIYNSSQPELPDSTSDKKVILYTGQLNAAYGMENLLEAFVELYKEDTDYELWICGGGGLANHIKELAVSCKGIKFMGYVGPEKVRECQQNATVLINPRQNIGEFTKYSFPSKTMEYLASQRPVIGYKLDGIPNDYDEFMVYVEDNSIDALKQKLKETCSLSKSKRQAMGKKARAFILEHKNPKKQCEKIVKMVEALK